MPRQSIVAGWKWQFLIIRREIKDKEPEISKDARLALISKPGVKFFKDRAEILTSSNASSRFEITLIVMQFPDSAGGHAPGKPGDSQPTKLVELC
jgi:hypothetical protein